jgi:hypothetical protein
MSTSFVVAAKINPLKFSDTAAEGDATTYEIDFRPWQADNSTITSVTWEVKFGEAGISNQTLTSGVASALISFSKAGLCLIAITAITASEKKKVFIEVETRDITYNPDGYDV